MTRFSSSPQEFLNFLERTMRITPEAAARARSAESQTGHPVDIIVRELGILAEDAIAGELANFLQLESITFATCEDERTA
jgi:general secretion pathway protein E